MTINLGDFYRGDNSIDLPKFSLSGLSRVVSPILTFLVIASLLIVIISLVLDNLPADFFVPKIFDLYGMRKKKFTELEVYSGLKRLIDSRELGTLGTGGDGGGVVPLGESISRFNRSPLGSVDIKISEDDFNLFLWDYSYFRFCSERNVGLGNNVGQKSNPISEGSLTDNSSSGLFYFLLVDFKSSNEQAGGAKEGEYTCFVDLIVKPIWVNDAEKFCLDPSDAFANLDNNPFEYLVVNGVIKSGTYPRGYNGVRGDTSEVFFSVPAKYRASYLCGGVLCVFDGMQQIENGINDGIMEVYKFYDGNRRISEVRCSDSTLVVTGEM